MVANLRKIGHNVIIIVCLYNDKKTKIIHSWLYLSNPKLKLNELLIKLLVWSIPFLFTPGSCNDLDLGIGSGSVPDDRLTASSVQSARTPAKNGRLGHTAGSSWSAEASDPSPYLQIDLQTLHIICAVSTQGNSRVDEWVEIYTLESSIDGSHWTQYYDEAGKVKVKRKTTV